MSKTLIVLLITLLITLSFFLFVKFFYFKTFIPQSAPSKQPSRVSISEANLYFSPNYLITQATSSAQVDIVLQTNSGPNLIQLEIAFDPKVLFNVTINPGDYFINPEIALYNIDIKNGRISYGLSCHPYTERREREGSNCINPNSNTVAAITFNTYNYGPQKETNLSFLPKTLIRRDNEEIKLKSIQNALVRY